MRMMRCRCSGPNSKTLPAARCNAAWRSARRCRVPNADLRFRILRLDAVAATSDLLPLPPLTLTLSLSVSQQSRFFPSSLAPLVLVFRPSSPLTPPSATRLPRSLFLFYRSRIRAIASLSLSFPYQPTATAIVSLLPALFAYSGQFVNLRGHLSFHPFFLGWGGEEEGAFSFFSVAYKARR